MEITVLIILFFIVGGFIYSILKSAKDDEQKELENLFL
jgi:hypothetical protein